MPGVDDEEHGGGVGRLKAAPTLVGRKAAPTSGSRRRGRLQPAHPAAILLVVDARHPGLASDLEAWAWIATLGRPAAVVVTKSDKLGRAELTRALGQIERECQSAVVAVSAETGAGMDDLWNRIATLVKARA